MKKSIFFPGNSYFSRLFFQKFWLVLFISCPNKYFYHKSLFPSKYWQFELRERHFFKHFFPFKKTKSLINFSRCNNGFPLPASQARFLKYCETKILSSVELREVFFNNIKNELYKVNSIIKRPKLAKTFEILAREGESAFYNGSLTDTIVNEIQTNGGIITRQDLQTYECQVKEPITYRLRNNVLLNTVPSPSCGSLLNFILAILDCKYILFNNSLGRPFLKYFIICTKMSYSFVWIFRVSQN